jgi:hypothetical protein
VAVTVVVDPAPPSAELPPLVAVVVTCAAKLLAAFCAFRIAAAGIGEPATMQANCKGVKRRFVSKLSSQLPCIQVTTSGRRFPDEARQIQPMSEISQFVSGD